jgi:alkylated DNA repair dioxygenase AlkB
MARVEHGRSRLGYRSQRPLGNGIPTATVVRQSLQRQTGTVGDAVEVRADAAFERLDLGDGAWVDVARGWLGGADELFEHLLRAVDWQTSRLFRYDHHVEERRLGASWRMGRPLPHPGLAGATRALQHRYRVQFDGFGLIQYRDGRDGQAFHRDTDMRWLDDTIVAILSLGAQRPWLLRPRTSKFDDRPGRGAVHDLSPGAGDLLVMGGSTQASWEHSVPYLGNEVVGPRISLQWRYAFKRGRPFMGASYRAPLTYTRSR